MNPIGPTDGILNGIRRVVRSLRVYSRGVEGEFGLSAAQLFILDRLQDELSLSINELAARSFTHQSTVSEVVAKLKSKNLVVLHESSEDRRKKLVALTKFGKALLKKAPKTPQARIVEGIEALSTKEQKDLARLFEKMIHHSKMDHEPADLLFETTAGLSSGKE